MSISIQNNSNRKSVLTKDGGLPAINIRRTLTSFAKYIPKKTLDFIVLFAFISTSLGELFGQSYDWKWFIIILLLLAAFMVKEVVEPSPKEDKKLKATDE